MPKKNFYIFNNFIYWTNLGNRPFGHEQGLNRPCLVIRTTKESEICTIIPLKKMLTNKKIYVYNINTLHENI